MSEELKKEISKHVHKVSGLVAYPDMVYFVKDGPLVPGPARSCAASSRALALGQALGDTSSVVNPKALDGISLIAK